MTHDDAVDAAVDLSQLALDIAAQPHPADMICRVTELAVKLTGCAAADIIGITEGGQLRITASSAPDLSQMTAKAWRQWPHTTIEKRRTANDTAMTLQRSSYLQQLRADTGIVQELIVPLQVDRTDHGYLRFLFTEPTAATVNRALITAFCAHASITLDRAALLNQVENLRLALDSNREIGAAVGVLMTRQQLTYSEALNHLKTAAQNTNRKLRDVAAEVLYTGQLPALKSSLPGDLAEPTVPAPVTIPIVAAWYDRFPPLPTRHEVT